MATRATFSFSINTAEELLTRVLLKDVADLEKSPRDSRHAIHSAFIAWHIYEWLWGTRFKSDFTEQKRVLGKVFRGGKREFATWCAKECPELKSMQGVAEGSKHLGTSAPVIGTANRSFAGSSQLGNFVLGDASLGGTGGGRLEVINSDGTTVDFLAALKTVVTFWAAILKRF